MLSRFHTIPACHGQADRQTDGRTELLYQYRASVCWRAIKTNDPKVFSLGIVLVMSPCSGSIVLSILDVFVSRSGEVDITSFVGKFYGSFNYIKCSWQEKEWHACLVKTYCLPMLLYGCEIWPARPVDLRSVDVAWNNAFCKSFNACWRESVKLLQFYCSCLPASLLVFQRWIIFWLKMLRSDNLILHTLAGCCRVSVAALYEKYSLDLHSELSTLSTCLVKRQFWLYFSDLCERV